MRSETKTNMFLNTQSYHRWTNMTKNILNGLSMVRMTLTRKGDGMIDRHKRWDCSRDFLDAQSLRSLLGPVQHYLIKTSHSLVLQDRSSIQQQCFQGFAAKLVPNHSQYAFVLPLSKYWREPCLPCPSSNFLSVFYEGKPLK